MTDFVWTDKVNNVDDVNAEDINAIAHEVERLEDDKVDKETGKGLSTNDFTNEDKEKLDSIETGAEVNAVDDVQQNGESVVDENKVAHIDAYKKEDALSLMCPHTETTSTTITGAIPHNAIDYTIYGNTGGVGDLVVDGDSDYAEYGGKYRIPVSVRGKNLLDSSLLMDAENYTLNSWYSGTYKVVAIPVPNGTYVFSTKHLSGYVYSNTYMTVTTFISGQNGLPPGSIFEGAGTLHDDKTIQLTVDNGYIYISSSYIQTSFLEEFYSNVQVMLEKGSAGTAYEPYIEPQTVNIYLDEPLGEGKSISLADTNVPIPLISKNTNIIEFGTSIQPSSVKIKYYQDINKVIANLQALILNQ